MAIRQNSQPYFEDDGRTVIEQIDIAGVEPSNFVGLMMIAQQGPNGQLIDSQQMPFPIEAGSVREAFEKYADAFAAYSKELEKKQRSGIVLARAVDPVVNGKRFT